MSYPGEDQEKRHTAGRKFYISSSQEFVGLAFGPKEM
jgi:hypothetical protein